jgi:2'-5' RNA ligase
MIVDDPQSLRLNILRDHGGVGALADAVASVAAFDMSFRQVRWFGEDVLWLAPDPAEPFHALTRAVRDRFPDHPPYSGEIADVVPHLTVGAGQPVAELRAAARAVERHLPVKARILVADLWAGSAEPGSWHAVASLPLGRDLIR